jgi:hypothetical protein
MLFSLHETVSILHETGKYRIIELFHNQALVLDEDGFERKIALSHLVKRTEIPTTIDAIKEGPTGLKPKKSVSKKDTGLKTIDLHAEALMISDVSQHLILEKQLAACKKFIHHCIQHKISQALIIHGVGEGILRAEVHRLLQGFHGLRFHDGNYSSRGIGSTLVEISYHAREAS